jgi:RNA polymerase sigma-70 factor (ECF subfamily)
MDDDTRAHEVTGTRQFDEVWRDNRAYLIGLATRMLGDAAEAEDVIQDAFDRLTRVDLDELDDVRGWLAVVVRRLCLDRLRSARSRRESVTGMSVPDGMTLFRGDRIVDPADRVTLDDQVQLALAVVLDRLTPAERTAFVLHDVFGFSFDAVAATVGRTPTACRQLASRARRSIRTGAGPAESDSSLDRCRILSERFIAACAGGDIAELMEALDPDVVGIATLFGHGPIVEQSGRPEVAQRLIGLFGPGTDSMLVPFAVERDPGAIAFAHGRLAAVIRLEETDGLVRHISSLVMPPK